MKKLFITSFVLIAFYSLINNCEAQWLSDVRLTNGAANSVKAFNDGCSIAASGNFLHVVWYDYRDESNPEIYYKRSMDGGVTWGADTRLTNDPSGSANPSVSVSGSVVHVVWYDARTGNNKIFYKRSADNGSSWGQDMQLSNGNLTESAYPSISVSGSSVHIVWQDNRDGNWEIYYKHSSDGGISWGTDTRLTNNSSNSLYPSVSVSGLAVNVIWQDDRDGNEEIYYKRSTDGGNSWDSDTRLTVDAAESHYPSVYTAGSVVHVVWQDIRIGGWEIYYKHSNDGGITWGADTRLTFDPSNSFWPSVAAAGNMVHVVWSDVRDGNWEIYYKVSLNGGITWGTDTRLTNNISNSYYPSISISGQALNIVWQDDRDGNFAIYYKHNNPLGIISSNSVIPENFSLSQNYPNPFNPSTNINIAVPKSGIVKLTIYDASGKQVELLVNQQLDAGTYKVDWNASNYPSGVYFYKMASGDFASVKKMILVK